MRRLAALAGVIGLSLVCTGCATAILARYDAAALDLPPEGAFPLGLPRHEVEAKLGKPDVSRPLPDGSRTDTYIYTLRNPEWAKLKWVMAVGTVITVGFTEPIWVPWASYDVLKHRRTATFRYDPDDVLLDHAPPSGYGPPDDSLPPLSFDAIRERCRSEESTAGTAPVAGDAPPDRAYGYHACVVRRLAIWGVE
jgi:hypothetical protein